MTHDEYKALVNRNDWREDEVSAVLLNDFPEIFDQHAMYTLNVTLGRLCDLLELSIYSKCDKCPYSKNKGEQ